MKRSTDHRRTAVDPLRRWLSSVSRAALVGGLLASPSALLADAPSDTAAEAVVVATDSAPAVAPSTDEAPLAEPSDDESAVVCDDDSCSTDEPVEQDTSSLEASLGDESVVACDTECSGPEATEASDLESVAVADEADEATDETAVQASASDNTDDSTVEQASLDQESNGAVTATDQPSEQAKPKQTLAEAAGHKREALRPAQFHGVTPGASTKAELIEAWGSPDRAADAEGETAGGEVLGYDLAPFKSVEALIESGKVAAVRVTLAEETPIDALVERLRLTELEPVEVTDSGSGALLAMLYPEKGLTLLVASTVLPPEAAQASHLVLEPLDARAFVLRCEQRGEHELTARLADLATAIEIDPTDAHAHWLKATQHLSAGQAADAKSAAEEASRLAPNDPSYRLTLAEAAHAAGDYDRAVLETRKVLDNQLTPQVVRAGALDHMGRLAAMGAASISARTIDFHNSAIEIADSLATTTDDRVRHLAKDTLLAAHLSVAKEIARRDYTDKLETVAEWIGRASGIAEERIEADNGGLDLRLRVAREALAALAEMRPTKDPAPWVEEAQATADALLAEHKDPLFRARVKWELGEAYQHALRIEHSRGDAEQALSYGNQAIEHLAAGGEPRVTSPAAEQLVGRLYFYLGAVNAVHNGNHAEAVGWYDKGRDILAVQKVESDFVVPRREGEELVSMGVSYWSKGQKEIAVRLTEEGARLMERAVKAGVIDRDELAVPYGNLATMHSRSFNSEQSDKYTKLVQSVKSPKRPAPKATVETSKPAATATAQAKKPTAKATPAPKQVAEKKSDSPSPLERLTRRFGRSFRSISR